MSNWAAHQEQLTGLPVAKRAKHAIHFKNNDGSITANFAGKPVHYLDGGIWKPIDTKLIALGDGYYGCPHSKVKIKPDGTVAVDGTYYVHRVELPSAYCGGTQAPVVPPVVVPPEIPEGKTFTVISAGGLNERDVPIGMPGSQVIGFHPRGSVLTSLETVAIGQDVWIRVSPWSVCALRFNGITYLE